MKCCGPKGRWKSNLIGKCLRDGKSYDDASVSPVVRQTLQHWGYRLTRAHFDAGSARVKAKGAAYLPRSQLQHVLDKKPAAPAPKKSRGRRQGSAATTPRRQEAGGAEEAPPKVKSFLSPLPRWPCACKSCCGPERVPRGPRRLLEAELTASLRERADSTSEHAPRDPFSVLERRKPPRGDRRVWRRGPCRAPPRSCTST